MLWPGNSGRAYRLLLSVTSALLLSAGWLVHSLVPAVFLAWLPLLELDFILEAENRPKQNRRFFAYCYLTFLLWNVLTTWWIINSTLEGALMAFFANALLMCIPLLLYRLTRRNLGNVVGLLSLLVYWSAFEYGHMNWDLSWSWLNLGNVFAFRHHWAQWYQYTGVLGGTLWVLAVNILLYCAFFLMPRSLVRSLSAAAALLLPILVSYYLFFSFKESGPAAETVVLQPNIDPYTEKFIGSPNYIPVTEQVQRFISLSQAAITPQTKFLLWPETALSDVLNEATLPEQAIIQQLTAFVQAYPGLNLITGITTYRQYPNKEAAPSTARYRDDMGYYDVFNTALWLSAGHKPGLYHKSMLVPGVEQMPYPGFFSFLNALVIDMGGTTGGLGKQADRSAFITEAGGIAPVICYESVYGEFVAGFARNGAALLGIITNDGWWGNTPGHEQHLEYARLRAIETRRNIARSANTGISAFLNARGDLLQTLPYLQQGSLTGYPRMHTEITPYVQYGDYIGRASAGLAPLLLAFAAFKGFTRRKGLKKQD